MEIPVIIIILTIVAAFYTSFMGGANDLANSMGTSVGSKSLTLKKAVFVAMIFSFAGSILVGSHVCLTIKQGIVDINQLSNRPVDIALGMFAALVSAGIFIHISNLFGLPVSTTHSIVGAVIGFGIVGGGLPYFEWGNLLKIVLSWIISPLSGGILGFLLFSFVRKTILNKANPVKEVKKWRPIFIFAVFFMITLSFIYKGLKNLHLDLDFKTALIIAIVPGLIISVGDKISQKVRRKTSHDTRYDETERIFKALQICTAGYMAFAYGANDVGNGIAPLAAIWSVWKNEMTSSGEMVPIWILLLGGTGIIIGFAVLGYKVVETIGKKITEITPSRGFSAEFGCATTVLVLSKLGMPISTTHTIVGAVIGVGFARGIAALNLRLIKTIIATWLITVPGTAICTMILYGLLKLIF